MNDDIANKLLDHVIDMKKDVGIIKEGVLQNRTAITDLKEDNKNEHKEIKTDNDNKHSTIIDDLEPIKEWWTRRRIIKSYGKWIAGGIVGTALGLTAIWQLGLTVSGMF